MLRNVIAPDLVSEHGKMFAGVLYLVMILISAYGCYKLRTDFKLTFLISEDSYISNYFVLKDKYFDSGFTARFYIEDPELNFSSLETQR